MLIWAWKNFLVNKATLRTLFINFFVINKKARLSVLFYFLLNNIFLFTSPRAE